MNSSYKWNIDFKGPPFFNNLFPDKIPEVILHKEIPKKLTGQEMTITFEDRPNSDIKTFFKNWSNIPLKKPKIKKELTKEQKLYLKELVKEFRLEGEQKEAFKKLWTDIQLDKAFVTNCFFNVDNNGKNLESNIVTLSIEYNDFPKE